ncbi:hypothetical protein WAI453_003449 [Rhynchosporium graminicola]|uniref:SWIM-type domain-containing protein n=1 Tax=Rhynchosporium graminicola TaxID=2792576 RepID=A0A1E1KPM1_9HELO|nr:uncharacterized protein RCO7_01705 [Rhynchosporium commune]
MTTLPNTRTLLTSLFNTLTTPASRPFQKQADQKPVNEPYDPPSNPLKTLPPSQRALLSTMHVLFTPPMLLQALDLLDRGLVLRIVERGTDQEGVFVSVRGNERVEVDEAGEEDEDRTVFPPQANVPLPSRSSPPPTTPILAPNSHSESNPQPQSHPNSSASRAPKSNPRQPPIIHQVRSSQPPKSRFRDASTSSTYNSSTSFAGTNIYTVRLHAWNCSCAAFAFASFPVNNIYPARSAWDIDPQASQDLEMDLGLDLDGQSARGRGKESGGVDWGEDDEWQFGGLSVDGKDGKGVPCCKHLLACVLGERWDILKGYVQERMVSREEMAGLGCEV